jgi:uncharacterized protein YneF (UPF0154 family)
MKGLKDIKPLVEVPDNSLMITILLLVALLILIGLIVWFFKIDKRVRRKKASPKELARDRLKSIDFLDTKDAVYRFSEDMRLLKGSNKDDMLESFIDKLERYKYKKDVPSLSDEDINMMKKMIKEATDV